MRYQQNSNISKLLLIIDNERIIYKKNVDEKIQ